MNVKVVKLLAKNWFESRERQRINLFASVHKPEELWTVNRQTRQLCTRLRGAWGETYICLPWKMSISVGVGTAVSSVPPRAHIAIRQDQLRGNGSIKRGSMRCMHSETDILVHPCPPNVSSMWAMIWLPSLPTGLYGRLYDCFRI